jgi:hypothetical protein
MSEAWKHHDRPCPPCADCGAELYEKFWGNGGWVKTEKGTVTKTHGERDCVRRLVAYRSRANDSAAWLEKVTGAAFFGASAPDESEITITVTAAEWRAMRALVAASRG